MSKYNTHTDPTFKKLQFLKLGDMYKVQQLKFYYKLVNNDLPEYFSHTTYLLNFESIMNTQKYIRHNVIETVNNTPSIIIDNIYTNSLHGFITYIKTTSL